MERFKQVVQLQKVYLDQVEHEVTVRAINGQYHCRVFTNGVLNQEAVCKSKADIGYTCKSMLRWEDKCGNWSDFASAARARLFA